MTNFTKKDIETLLEGYWYREPKENWSVNSICMTGNGVKVDKEKDVLFIAMDSDTWHKGTGNTAIYGGWNDTHKALPGMQKMISGAIVNKPIPELSEDIPQFVMEFTYDAVSNLADHAYQNLHSTILAITGTAGKSTVKNIFHSILSERYSVISSNGNHNTRTGVAMTVGRAISQPDFLILESAASGLWMRPHGIMNRFPADIAIITSIDGAQKRTAKEIAIHKSKVAEGMNHKGTVILNRDMNEYETVYSEVKKYNKNIVTYGFSSEADTKFLNIEEQKIGSLITMSVMGEEITFSTKLNGHAMVQNLGAIFTTLKLLDIPFAPFLAGIENYVPANRIQSFEPYSKYDGTKFTLLDDGHNATRISMLEAFNVFKSKAHYYHGKKIAVLGRIVDLTEEEAKIQHESFVQPLIDAKVDLVFAHGKEMKHMLRKLPERMIGGYFEDSKKMAESVANVIEEDDYILIKGSQRASNFANVKKHLLEAIQTKPEQRQYSYTHPFATAPGAATYNLSSGEMISEVGNIHVQQNEGIANVLLIDEILNRIFSGQLHLHEKYIPGKREVMENKARNSLLLSEKLSISLAELLQASVLNRSPNALLMLANKVIGSNKEAMSLIQNKANEIGLNTKAALNISGRRIPSNPQKLTLTDLFKAGKLLFSQYPFLLDQLSVKNFSYNGISYDVGSNLYTYGLITHGLFFGYKDSLAITLSQFNGQQYITVAIGARDYYERDHLIMESLKCAFEKTSDDIVSDIILETEKSDFTINVIGDTYFGEFYTDRRLKRNREDALTTKGRSYSFDKIRPMLNEGDFNICNFEAAITSEKNNILQRRKPYVLHSTPEITEQALKSEGFDLATLATNHLMDYGIEGLEKTLAGFKRVGIKTMGAGFNQKEAETPVTLLVSGTRITFFNAYWYRRPMYREFDFYAIGNQPGVASLSGNILRDIEKEKSTYPNGKIVVFAHWGVDFKEVLLPQRQYAKSIIEAGADMIIGHGPHKIQEVEVIKDKPVVYSIGNGVFNSNGEYHTQFVPPYSFFVQLHFKNGELDLRLYPIYTNNLNTFWQPRFVTDDEFQHCTHLLKSYGSIALNPQIKDSQNYYVVKTQTRND